MRPANSSPWIHPMSCPFQLPLRPALRRETGSSSRSYFFLKSPRSQRKQEPNATKPPGLPTERGVRAQMVRASAVRLRPHHFSSEARAPLRGAGRAPPPMPGAAPWAHPLREPPASGHRPLLYRIRVPVACHFLYGCVAR